MPQSTLYAIIAALVVVILGASVWFLYGGHGFGVHEGRGGRREARYEQRDVAQPPAVLDKLQLTGGRGGGGGRGGRRGGGGRGREPAPELTAAWTGASNNSVSLDNYRGHLVVLNLWATWCGPCITELPALARAKTALAGESIVIVAVDLEKKDPSEIAAFLKAHDAAALDVNVDRELALMRQFGAYGLPLTIIFDRDGHEIARAMGPQKWDDPAAIAYLRQLSDAAAPERRAPRGAGRGIGIGRMLGHGLRHLGRGH